MDIQEKKGSSLMLMVPGWFAEALTNLIEVTEAFGAEWMLLGAVPVRHYGWPRATNDLDLAVSIDVSASDSADKWMTTLGYSKLMGPLEISKKGIWLSKYQKQIGENTVGIDIFFSVGEWQSKAIKRRIIAKIDGNHWWIPSLEDLILYKLIACREKDFLDLEGILDKSLSKVDWNYLGPWITTFDLEAKFREIMESYGGAGREG
jgi:hypothetical protein